MKQNDQNTQPEGFDANSVGYLLDSAQLAEQGGNSRLAIHLYCAAFAASKEQDKHVDERAVSGLRQAWTLACEQGDRPTAETIFNDLIPYNSDEQTQAALSELQEMAMNQLGVGKDELEDIALSFAEEVRAAGIDIDGIAQHLDQAQNEPANKIDLTNLASTLFDGFAHAQPSAPAGQSQAIELAGASQNNAQQEQPSFPRYDNLSGFEAVKEKMQQFGIIDSSNAPMQSFMEQAQTFHGVQGPVLSQNFLFVGPSREDIGFFAQATAHEIGWPTVTMMVDVNEMGDGTIKVAAPVKRTLFGPPRVTDFPNPCVLVIQNIDILQDLFWNEEQAFSKGYGSSGGGSHDELRFFDAMRSQGAGSHAQGGMYQQRSFQNEIVSYLSALFARGGVFVIATSAKSSAKDPLVLSQQLENLLDNPVEISVELPTLSERKKVIEMFAKDHPSFHDIDCESLARLSEGLSRFELYMSCGQAVEIAYSDSLQSQCHKMVKFEDILNQIILYLPQDSTSYRLVEDYLVTLFAAELETDFFDTPLATTQTSIEFEDKEDNAE